MGSYLMMLYVSREQEKAMKKLFSDNGWKYCKPDILQLTDELGGVEANIAPQKVTENIPSKITSPPKTTRASVTSPLRPATRSQTSKLSASSFRRDGKKTRKNDENIGKFDGHNDIPIVKEECEEIVDDGDLNDYMEHGDEDDDFIDDDDKEMKRTRQFSKTTDSDHSFTDREDFTEKLDGTEEIDPEELKIMFDGDENSTDDDGNESNTDSLQVGRNTEPTVKVLSAKRIRVKRYKRDKLDKNTNPLQYQCGFCKVRYQDKRHLNKHLTDKECLDDMEDIGKVVNKAGDNKVIVKREDEPMFDNELLASTDKISGDSDSINLEGQIDDPESSKSKGLSVEEDDKSESKGEKNFYKCNKCDLAYKMAHLLKNHQIVKHGMKFEDSFECNVCHILYGSEYILSLHKLDKHSLTGDMANSVQCEDCDLTCDDFEVYKLHKKREHNIMVLTEVNRKYVCNTCGKAYTRPDSLKYHCEVIHLGTKLRKQKPRPTERKHVCDFCGKAFLRRTNLSEHISVKHTKTAKRHKCDECDETFLRPYALEYHKNKVHLKNKPYECDKCHKTYFTPINLRQHKEICYKEEEEKDACPHCDKRFVHKRNLEMHLEAVHSEEPLTCDCGYIIKWRSSIAKHKRKCPLQLGKRGMQNSSKVGNKGQNVYIKIDKQEAMETDTVKEETVLDISNAEGAIDTGFTTISTDSGEQVISDDIAQALREQGLLVDRTMAGTLKMGDGKSDIEEDPSVQSYTEKGVTKRQSDKSYVFSQHQKDEALSKFVIARKQNLSNNSSTIKLSSNTGSELCSTTMLKGETVIPSKNDSDQKMKIQKIQGRGEKLVHVISKNVCPSDDLCKGKDQSSFVSLLSERQYCMRGAVDIEKKVKSFTCDDCGKVYTVRSCWKRHMKSHKPGVEYCGQCNMYFDNAELLEAHKRKVHSTSFSCMLCKSQFARKAILRKHMINFHPELCEAKFSCSESNCKAVFDDEELYQDHLNIHFGRTPHRCSQCDKSFSTKSLLKLHKNKHSGESLMQCKECERQFKSYGALHNHRASVHEKKRFKCNQCNKVFIYRSGFCKHLLSHKKDSLETTSSFTCSVISEQTSDSNEGHKSQETVGDSNKSEDKTCFEINKKDKGENVSNISNQACPVEVSGSQTFESINQVEQVMTRGLSGMGVSPLQPPVLGGQEVAVLPLNTVQLDPSTRIMWLCRT